MFIKTEKGALINSDYIRVIFIDSVANHHALTAETDNGDHWILAEFDGDAEDSKTIMDRLFESLDEEKSQ